MSVTLNILLLMISINLFLYLGYRAELIGNVMSTGFMTLASIAGDQSISWTTIVASGIYSFLSSIPIVGVLILIMGALSLVTGQAGLTGVGGGGYGAMHALTIVAITIFVNFVCMPDITGLGLPTEITFLTRTLIGMMIMVAIFGLMRGE
jgi:hypothetical protein